MRARFLSLILLAACAPREVLPPPARCGDPGEPACPSCSASEECAGLCDGAVCACRAGSCVASPCSADLECADGQVCDGGACAAPAPASAVTGCDVEPRRVILREGDRQPLAIHASGGAGPLRAGAPALSVDGVGATLSGDGVLTGAAAAGDFTVTASFGGASCSASGIGLGGSPSGLRVVVVDAFTGQPVAGATVRVEDGGAGITSPTSARGEARIAGAPAGARTLSVFSPDHDYLTVSGVEGDDLLLPVRRPAPADRSGGFRGEFGPAALFDSTTTLQLGIAGTAIPGDLTDLSLEKLLGPIVRVTVPIGAGLPLDVPAGVSLGLGRTWFKQDYAAIGLPGLCGDPARDGDGTCGERTAWGLAGGLPLSAVPPDLLRGKTVDTATLLSAILPYSDALSSAVRRGVGYDLLPRVDGAPDMGAFTEADLQATAPLALAVPIAVPHLPSAARPLSFVIALAAAREAGASLVPLGITAGSDASPRDGVVDEPLTLHLAPAHAGLAPAPYAVVVLALDPGTDPDRCAAGEAAACPSAAAMVLAAPALPDGQPLSFEGPFLPPPEATTFDAGTRTFDASAVAGSPTLMRLLLNASSGRTWTVLGAPGVVRLPPVPAGIEDPLADAGLLLRVQSIRARRGLSDLAAGREARLSDLLPEIAAFGSLDRPR